MPRFVILHHQVPPKSQRISHWDLMLEQGDHLTTWEFPKAPEVGTCFNVVPLANHRLEYLDYEGPLTRQRGTVSRYDWGKYTTILEDAEQQVILLDGQLLVCRLTIGKIPGNAEKILVQIDPR